ncbi:MAG TPA: DNA-primase RepB domain-containing protein [Solirubrobacterales bacterium]|nr:DNA-primase RepB domain-containing protein [Solirubrobacterales bacterium]
MTVASPPRAAAAALPLAGPLQPVAIRDRGGQRVDRVLDADGHAALLTELIHTGRQGFVELTWAPRLANGRLGEFRRHDFENYVRPGRREEFLGRVRALRPGPRRELFLTPPTLRVPVPGNASVESSAVAWVDIDDPRRLAALRRFAHRPHAVVASGSGGVHAYWLLAEELPAGRCESLNRKLAAALGADPVSANRGRLLRLPGSLNHKHVGRGRGAAWCRMVMCDLASAPHRPETLAAGLRDPKAPRPARPVRRPPSWRGAEPWWEMESADYYRVIVGAEPGRRGIIRCPAAGHPDKHPSAHLIPGGGWCCFSCGAGGSAVDMVAALRGYPTGEGLRDEKFKECVAELRRIFGVEDG